jgi:hypothetical protein
MRDRRVAVAILAGAAATLAAALPAWAVGQAHPRAGKFVGQEVFDKNPLAVSFTVPRARNRVIDFTGQAQVNDGCTNHITGFSAPRGPMPISPRGRFSAVSTNYSQKGVRVKVTGAFPTKTKARGRISVTIAKNPGCNASRRFTAVRVRQTN